MHVTIDPRRPRRRTVAILTVAMLVAIPSAALASHQFPDVLNTNPFHDNIEAIAGAGITAGFPDGGYHPSDPVTRQAMAAFMHRGFGRIGTIAGSNPLTNFVTVAAGDNWSDAPVPLQQFTITVPGTTSDVSDVRQMVYVHGRAVFYTNMTAALAGCTCEFTAQIRDLTSNGLVAAASQSFEGSSTFTTLWSLEVDGVVGAEPGQRTYQLEVALTFRDDPTNAASFQLSTPSLTAMTFPFGPSGTSDL